MTHTGIAEVGSALVDRLRSYMVPEVIMNPDHIGLCSPADKGDLALGLYLYDIRESDEIRGSSMIMVDSTRQKFPSSFLNLYYMITAYSNGDIKYRAEEEQKILGRVIQIFADFATFDDMLQGVGAPEGETVPTIVMQNLSLEDKMRIWTVPEAAYKTSLFYRVGPVEINSQKIKDAQRVVALEFNVEHDDRRA